MIGGGGRAIGAGIPPYAVIALRLSSLHAVVLGSKYSGDTYVYF